MIPERGSVAVESTVQGADVAMSIDQSALAHIMNVLTDLYSDPELAVIREYSTNALDSHIEAGQSRPIEVTTPTELRPLLTIRDYGVGLDADDIENIYSRYGASTKRTTNDAVGMLGLGCKSALAFVNQFTLAGIKNGKRIMVSIGRDEDGAGTMTVLEDAETDDPDGVEVCIPADTLTDLETKAEDFFAYWEPGLVLLNGEEPAQLEGYAVGEYVVAERASASWETSDRHGANPLTVVMGNVSYPPPDGYWSDAVDSLPKNKRIVVRVPIGAVHFTPAREGLQDSERTRKSLDVALEGFQREVNAAVTDAVTNAPTRPAAAKALIEARAAFGAKNVPDLQWEGEEIPTSLSAEDLPDKPDGVTGSYRLWETRVVKGYRGGESYRTPARQISLDDAGAHPWVLNYNNTKWSATQRRKLNRYLEHFGLHTEPNKAVVYVTDAPSVPRPEWIDGAVTSVHWHEIRAWKDPLKQGTISQGGFSYAGTYPCWIDKRQHETFEAEALAEKNQRKVFYVEGEKWDQMSHDVAQIFGEGAVVVSLTPSRAAKFKRLFPEARDGVPVARAAVAGKLAKLSTLERGALAVEGRVFYPRNVLSGMDPETVTDPRLSDAIRVLRIVERGELRRQTEHWFPMITGRPDAEGTPAENMEEVLQPYPLLSSMSIHEARSHLDHVTLYVNAVHAANQIEEA